MRTQAYAFAWLTLATLALPAVAQQPQQNPYNPQPRQAYPQQQPQQAGGTQQAVYPQQQAGYPQQQAGQPRQGTPRYADAGELQRRQQMQQQQAATQAPFQINAEHQAYLDEVLKYWEYRSNQIKTFRCNFTRWEYKPAFLADPNKAWTISEGVVQYGQPDKGLFRIDRIGRYTPPQRNPDGSPVPGSQESYASSEGVFGEYWICDGESVFEYNYSQKQLVERELPQEMRGQAIADGPLPFLFGAKADRLKARYWMRVFTPSDVKGEYWIDARPKTRQDAANYERIDVILDQTDFLPKAMQIYLPGGSERTSFQFAERKVNDPWEMFKRDFSKPSLPRGWTKVTERPPAAIPPRHPVQPAGAVDQARRPVYGPQR